MLEKLKCMDMLMRKVLIIFNEMDVKSISEISNLNNLSVDRKKIFVENVIGKLFYSIV